MSEELTYKICSVLGDRAIGMTGEFRLATTHRKNITNDFANKGIRIPYQPGLLNMIDKTEPDIMVSDGFMQWTYAPLLKRMWSKKVPHVMCYERTAYTERNCQWYRKLYRKCTMRYIDAYCVNGKLCGEYLELLGAKNDSVFYGQMAADTEGLANAVAAISKEQVNTFRSNLNVSSGRLYLYVGQLIPRKGIMELLKAWRMAKQDGATLLIVGDGSQKEELQTYCNQWNLNIVFTGKIDYKYISQYYRIADLFIMPTLEDNWSLVVPEAMACGLPIACSKYNGCWPELVKPENGWLFDPRNIQETSELLKHISSLSSDKMRIMGEKSREIVKDYSPQRAALAIYHSCEYVLMKKQLISF